MKKLHIFEQEYLPLILKSKEKYSLKKNKILSIVQELHEKYHKDIKQLEESAIEGDKEQELDDILNRI